MWLLMAICIFVICSYAAMVGLFIIGISRLRRRSLEIADNDSKRSLSIIIALRNEESNVEGLINSLTNQNYPKYLVEIILVNDHSTDSTWAIANTLTQGLSNIILADLPPLQSGKKHAVALGVKLASNSLIVLTDADCLHPSEWLLAISKGFSYTETVLQIGPVMIGPANSIFEKMQALEHASLTASTLGACGLKFPFMASSANIAFDKAKLGFSFEMLNPVQPSGDDVFLLHSAKRLGYSNNIRCIHNPSALVTTMPAKTVGDFFRQRARWASKAPSYSDFASIAIALIVLIFNLMLVVLSIAIIVEPNLWIYLVIGFAVKIAFDLPLLWIYLKEYKSTSLLKVFIPLQLIYPFYIVVAFGLSCIGKVKWKEGD